MQLVSLIISVLSFAVSVAVIIIFNVTSYKKQKFDERLAKFNSIDKILSSNLPQVCLKLVEVHKKLQESDSWVFDKNLIYKKSWIPKSATIKLSEIKLTADGEYNRLDEHLKIYDKSCIALKHGNISDNMLLFGNQNIYNNMSYAVKNIEVANDVLSINVMYGNYFDYIDTCFRYKFEAASLSLNSNEKKAMVRKMHSITNFNNRFCAIGISTIIILKNYKHKNNDPKHYFLLHERSSSVSDESGLIAAIPGGNFQPSAKTANEIKKHFTDDKLVFNGQSTALEVNVAREIFEEVLGVDEYSALVSDEQVAKHPLFEHITKNLYFLGCGLNPVTAFLEVLTFCVIDMRNENNYNLFSKLCSSTETNGEIKVKIFDKHIIEHYKILPKSCLSLKHSCKSIADKFNEISSILDS